MTGLRLYVLLLALLAAAAGYNRMTLSRPRVVADPEGPPPARVLTTVVPGRLLAPDRRGVITGRRGGPPRHVPAQRRARGYRGPA